MKWKKTKKKLSKICKMFTHKRKKKLSELAEFVNKEYSDDGFIEPENIAKAKGISYSYGYYQDAFDGMLEYSKQDGFHIFINLERGRYPSSGRSRFTFCHELGHYFLDEHRNALITGASKPHKSTIDFRSNLEVEREADEFAANLLIPRNILLKKIGKERLSANLIKDVADFFGSSYTSTAIRILKTNAFPFLLLKSENRKIQWAWPSKQLKSRGLKSPIKSLGDLNKDSLTHIYSNPNMDVPDSTILRQGTTAAAWFRWVNEVSSQNIIMIEEILSLGEYGILTIVYPDET